MDPLLLTYGNRACHAPSGAVKGTKDRIKTGANVPIAKTAAAPSVEADAINYMVNPFAVASIVAPNASIRGASLSRIAEILHIPTSVFLSPTSSPLRHNALGAGGPSSYAVIGVQEALYDPRSAQWNPPYNRFGRWSYVAPMFNGTPRFTDPVQGAITNCPLISSLASVALTMPSRIERRATMVDSATLSGEERIRNIVLSDGWGDHNTSLSERVPQIVAQPGGPSASLVPFAQNGWSISGQSYASWPAVFEKAIAIHNLRVAHDQPNYTRCNYWGVQRFDESGNVTASIHPITAITGIPTERIELAGHTTDEIWSYVSERAGGKDGRAMVPMVCGVDNDPRIPAVEYDRESLAPNHAYSLLGAIQSKGRRFLVLRNPWGCYEPSGDGTMPGVWQGVELSANNGLFAYDVDRFKRYFGNSPLSRIYSATRQ